MMTAAAANLILKLASRMESYSRRTPDDIGTELRALDVLYKAWTTGDIRLARIIVEEKGLEAASAAARGYLGPPDVAEELFGEVRAEYEAGREPDLSLFILKANEAGELVAARFGGMMEVYLLYAPIVQSDDEREEIRVEVEQVLEEHYRRIDSDPLYRLQLEADLDDLDTSGSE